MPPMELLILVLVFTALNWWTLYRALRSKCFFRLSGYARITKTSFDSEPKGYIFCAMIIGVGAVSGTIAVSAFLWIGVQQWIPSSAPAVGMLTISLASMLGVSDVLGRFAENTA